MSPMKRLLVALTALALVAAACGGDDDAESTDEPVPMEERDADDIAEDAPAEGDDIEGLMLYPDQSAGHEGGDLDYPQNPPVGGDHSPLWQKCGAYTVEVPEERVVHSMEHGAVWLAYEPGLDVSSLELTVTADEHLLMSPVQGLAAPIVLAAWGAQLEVDGPDDPRIDAFIARFVRQGPEGAPCVGGGVGQPPDDPGPALDL